MLRKKKNLAYTFFLSLFVIAGFLSIQSAKAVGTTQYLSGQSLSTNFGLTNFYDPNYGVTIDAQGNLTGYAWNAYAGWLKFGGLSGFPSQPGTTASNAKIVPGNGNGPTKIVGWARFCSPVSGGLSGCINGGNTISNGGWSGWISFDGSNYGVTIGGETPLGSGNFPLSGYAWGSDDNGNSIGFGWMDMSTVKLTGTPTPPPGFRLFGGSPSDGIPQTATNSSSNDLYMTVNIGSTLKLTWNTNGIQVPKKCTATTSQSAGIPNPNYIQGWAGAKDSFDSTSVTGGHNIESVKTLNIPGTYTYKLDCLPIFGQQLNTQKVIVTVSATPIATLSLTGNPLTVQDLNPKTNLTYSKIGSGTGAGGAGSGSVAFNSCIGAAADINGLPYTTAQIPNWVGARTIPNPSITVTNVNVPDEDVWYSIYCTTASGPVNPPPVHVHRLPPNDPTPLLNLTFDDGLTQHQYAPGPTTESLVWDDNGSGANFSSCKGVVGTGLSDWSGINQQIPPGGPVIRAINSNAGDTTTFQLSCIDSDTGNTVLSNTIGVIIIQQPLNPTLDLRGDIGNGLSDGPETFPTPAGGNVNLQWSIGDVASCVANSTETNPTTGATVQGPWPNHSISAVDGVYTDGPFNISTTTTFKVTCNTADPDVPQLSDTYTARIPGIPDPIAPAGPKIPVFQEH